MLISALLKNLETSEPGELVMQPKPKAEELKAPCIVAFVNHCSKVEEAGVWCPRAFIDTKITKVIA